jgi:hypothetical protein
MVGIVPKFNRETNNATLSEQIQNFGSVLTMWHYLFFYWTLELFRQCGMIGFSIGHWNWSDSVAILVFLWDFGTMHTVGNVPMSNRETNNATLSEQLHSPI